MPLLSSRETFEFVFYCASLVVFVFLFPLHAYEIYNDLFSEERKVVSHRREAPTKNNLYRATTYLMLGTLLMYLVYIGAGCFSYFTATPVSCVMMDVLGSAGLSFGRTFQYAVFMLRLHHIYRDTTYKYPVWMLTIIVVVGFIGTFSIPVFVLGHSVANGVDSIVESGDYGCEVIWNEGWIIAFVLTELIVNVVVVIMFLIPLRKTAKALESTGGTNKKTVKLMFFASKVFVLAATAALSTVVAFLFVGATDLPISLPVDAVINSFCMLLMSPYYSDHEERWYRMFCRPCIWVCCQRKHSLRYHYNKKQSIKDRDRATSNIVSASSNDTMSEVRVDAKAVPRPSTTVTNHLQTQPAGPNHSVEITPVNEHSQSHSQND